MLVYDCATHSNKEQNLLAMCYVYYLIVWLDVVIRINSESCAS